MRSAYDDYKDASETLDAVASRRPIAISSQDRICGMEGLAAKQRIEFRGTSKKGCNTRSLFVIEVTGQRCTLTFKELPTIRVLQNGTKAGADCGWEE